VEKPASEGPASFFLPSSFSHAGATPTEVSSATSSS